MLGIIPSLPYLYISMIKIKKIQKNIYIIKEEFYAEHANLYLFVGKNKCLLIDAGVGIYDIRRFLEKSEFKNIYVLPTHEHYDHTGGLKYFSPKNIFITREIYKNIKDKKLLGLEYFSPRDLSSGSKKLGKKYSIQIPKIKLYIQNNITLEDFDFEIIKAPGHTDSSIMLFEKNTKLLVSGDALYDGKPYFDLPNSNITDLKKTLKEIKKLKFKTLLPGHNQMLSKSESNKVISKWLKILA